MESGIYTEKIIKQLVYNQSLPNFPTLLNPHNRVFNQNPFFKEVIAKTKIKDIPYAK